MFDLITRVYDLSLASLYPKKVGGHWYLREMGRVDGSRRDLRAVPAPPRNRRGVQTREAAALPYARHLAFGDVAAAGVLEDLGVAAVIDEVTGSRPAGASLSAGTYPALSALSVWSPPAPRVLCLLCHRRRLSLSRPGAVSPLLLCRVARRLPVQL